MHTVNSQLLARAGQAMTAAAAGYRGTGQRRFAVRSAWSMKPKSIRAGRALPTVCRRFRGRRPLRLDAGEPSGNAARSPAGAKTIEVR